MKKEIILNIEDFLQNREVNKTLEHFYGLYRLITKNFPDYKLPICPFDIGYFQHITVYKGFT